jgi:formylglycine-generating enzyme required for sulfatase activity
MKRQGVTLPERRVELYQKYVETLLSTWNRARGLGRPPARDLDVVETVRILAPLALWMHQVAPGVGLVKQGDLQRQLAEIYAGRGEADPEMAARRFLSDVREHAGLLLERGTGTYGFIHLTFEEYLAAAAVAQKGQRDVEPVVEVLAEYIGNPAWREVVLLTIGYLGIVQQRDEAAGAVVGALIEQQPGESGQAVAVAGEAVVDAWPGGVTPACREQVVQSLVKTMGDDERVKPTLRAAAGDVLARLGDPRPGVGLSPPPRVGEGLGEGASLPNIVWCEVPEGSFLMGSNKARDSQAYDDELPQHEVTLPAYSISKYPVTNTQYAAFVAAGGYRERRYWTRAGWEWKGERTTPETYGGVFDLPNHPVVMVTWYEAIAFCRWLTERLHEVGDIGSDQEVMLPAEAAARGEDGRIYPWGNEFNAAKCNMRDTGIGTTSAVGIFPAGASPYGVEDLSGNVDEWCRTRWRDSYQEPADESLEGDLRRVLRGGAFYSESGLVRCAYRNGDHPLDLWYYLGFRVVLVAPG